MWIICHLLAGRGLEQIYLDFGLGLQSFCHGRVFAFTWGISTVFGISGETTAWSE